MSTDIIYFVHWHVEASRSREDDQDYTVLDRFAGFDNETLAKVLSTSQVLAGDSAINFLIFLDVIHCLDLDDLARNAPT